MNANAAEGKAFPRPRSTAVFDGPERAAARAYMKGVGFDDDDLKREGKMDQAKGNVKQGVADAKEKVGDLLDGDDKK